MGIFENEVIKYNSSHNLKFVLQAIAKAALQYSTDNDSTRYVSRSIQR